MSKRAEARKHYQPRKPREPKPRTSPADYREWTPKDLTVLKNLAYLEHDTGYIANKLDRPRGDVAAKMRELHLNNGYEPDPADDPEVDRACLTCDTVFRSRHDHVCPQCRSHVEFHS